MVPNQVAPHVYLNFLDYDWGNLGVHSVDSFLTILLAPLNRLSPLQLLGSRNDRS